MTEYNPDSWVVLKMTHGNKAYYKILAGWSGSYLHGASWKLNSGITRAEETEDAYVFHGHSGSTYRCKKDRFGLSMATFDIFHTMEKTYPEQVSILENLNWAAFDFKETA